MGEKVKWKLPTLKNPVLLKNLVLEVGQKTAEIWLEDEIWAKEKLLKMAF